MSNAKLAKSGKHPDLKMGTYNCNGLTNERLSWLIGSQDGTQQGLGFDFLGLTECHGGEWLADVWGRQRLLVSGPRDETKNEKAAGVHIACSERGARAVRGEWHRGPWLKWIEIDTTLPVKVFCFAAYIPHAGRTTGPFADDVFGWLEEEMSKLPPDSIKIVMGDFNARLGRIMPADRGKNDCTGQWSPHDSDNEMGAKLRQIMRDQDLVEASTFFQPKVKKGGAATFQPYGEVGLGKKPVKLDGFLISSAWKSSVMNCQARWGITHKRWPRTAKGVWKDHAVLEAHVRLRFRTRKLARRDNRAYMMTDDGRAALKPAFRNRMSEYDAELIKKAAARDAAAKDFLVKAAATDERTRIERAGLMERLAAGTALEGIIDNDDGTGTAAATLDAAAAGPLDPLRTQPESDQDDAGSPRKRMDARRKDEGGLEDEGTSGPGPGTSGQRTTADWIDLTARIDRLQAVVKKTVNEDVPKPEATVKVARYYSPSARTLEIKERHGLEANARAVSKEAYCPEQQKKDIREFNGSCRSDKREWVAKLANQLAVADEAGDMAEVTKLAGILERNGQGGIQVRPQKDAEGNRYKTMLEELDAATKWGTSHFAETTREKDRQWTQLMDAGLAAMSEEDIDLSDERQLRALRKLKLDKAVGHDDGPVEFLLAVEEARLELFEIIRIIFVQENVTAEFVRGVFCMLYKGPKKGSSDSWDSYRPVDLLSHLFKLLSRIMLDELIVDTDLYQSASQAGFGAGVGRGCRTQLLRKRLFIDRVLALGLVGALALFDYSGAFDGSSHKALDSTLEEAGTRRKVRAVHRSICEQANGTLRIRDAGETHLSNPFDINRGSVQGDLCSARVFITGVSGITREADTHPTFIDLDTEIRLQCLELQKIQSRGGEAAKRLAAIMRAVVEDRDECSIAVKHAQGVKFCGGISTTAGHKQCPHCLVDNTDDMGGQKYIGEDARLRDEVQVLRCRSKTCAGCSRCTAAHTRRQAELQERNRKRIDEFGASEGLQGIPDWPESVTESRYDQWPAGWLAVARKGALSLYEARARDREIYAAKLKVLQAAAEAGDPESTAATPHDQLGSFHLSETRLPEGVVDRCRVCDTACVEPGLCARCTELGFPPELETTESDDDDQTSASDEEASAVIDYRDADSCDWNFAYSCKQLPKAVIVKINYYYDFEKRFRNGHHPRPLSRAKRSLSWETP